MARVTTFKKCLSIMIDIEKYLTKKEEITIDATQGSNTIVNLNTFERHRSGIVDKIDNDGLQIIKVLEPGNNAHAIVLVKNKFLEKGWSLFDANGKQFFPFKIMDNSTDVTQDYLEVTGRRSLNYGSEVNNPGYCGTISVIFMIFFSKNKDDPEWPNKWYEVGKKLSTQISYSQGTYANNLASQIQLYLSNVRNINDNVIDEIYQIINDYLYELDDNLYTNTKKKQKISGGVRTSKKKTQKPNKQYDPKYCYKHSFLLDSKERCKDKLYGPCGKNIYLENGQYFYCRNYKPLIGKSRCDYLSTVKKRQGICSNQDLTKQQQDLIKKFTTKTKGELVSRLTQLKKLGYTQQIYDGILTPLADNAEFLNPQQKDKLKKRLLTETKEAERIETLARQDLKRLEDKEFETKIRERLKTLRETQGGTKKKHKKKSIKKKKRKSI